ncbi:MAG: MFS transporter [Ferruginibacter sp.]|nr:MFS transporter [Cytophagales bacterium]
MMDIPATKPSPSPSRRKSLPYWQTTTAVGLFVGYSGYYLCRSNLAIATPLIIQEFGSRGINKEVMGQIASVGVIFYAVGKVVNGILGDFVGGKKIFVLGMVGAVLATVVFGLGAGVGVFFAAWAANRLVQSMGWGGLVKMTVNWFSFRAYGRIMALLSLSFLAGDIVAKLLLGQLLEWGLGWRSTFFVAAAMLGVIALVLGRTLKENPEAQGLPSPEENPDNLFTSRNAGDSNARPASLGALLRPYFRSLSFLLVLTMSFGLTAIREAFNFWVPTYLFEAAGLSGGAASQFSALFPLLGMVSILGAGYLSDKLLKGKKGVIILVASVLITGVLVGMASGFAGNVWPLVFISLAGLLLLGPYSFLAGAMSLDAGGRQGAATAAGLVDAIGYLGGTLALWLTGRLAEQNGWNSAFFALALIAAATAGAALVFYLTQERKNTRSPG